MTRYRYYTATTLDGFLADEHDSLDWLLTQPQEDGGANDYDAFIRDVGVVVMGATTYLWIRDHLAETGESWPYDMASFVFTHRELPRLDAGVRFVQGAPGEHREAIEQAAAGKDVWMCGGGGLAADFAEAGMLQELIVSVAPVTLGAGRPLFPRPFDLQLTEVGRNGAFACMTYEVVGPREPGSAG